MSDLRHRPDSTVGRCDGFARSVLAGVFQRRRHGPGKVLRLAPVRNRFQLRCEPSERRTERFGGGVQATLSRCGGHK
jgi:hypothetical protein